MESLMIMKEILLTITNLKKLRDGLMANREKVEPHLEMKTYRSNMVDGEVVSLHVDHMEVGECGTHGCILGWCPIVTDLKPVSSDYGKGKLDWNNYSDRIFPALTDTVEWHIVFGGQLSNDFDERIKSIGEVISDLEGEI